MIKLDSTAIAALTMATLASCTGQTTAPRLVPSGCPTIVFRTSASFFGDVGVFAPVFALYPDGLAIYSRADQPALEPSFSVVRLTTPEQQQFLSAVGLTELARLGSEYSRHPNFEVSDQGWYVFDLSIDGQHRRVEYEGDAHDVPPSAIVPPALMRAIRYLISYSNPRAISWKPDSFRVVISIDSTRAYGPGARIGTWPARWPGLALSRESPEAPWHREVALPFSEFAMYRHLARTVHGLVRIDARQAWLSYRIPFPCESWWLADST